MYFQAGDIMQEKWNAITIKRTERFIERIVPRILGESVQLEARLATSDDPVPFDGRLSLDYKSVKEGDEWTTKTWACGWLELSGSVPSEWHGKNVIAHLDVGGEGLVFSPDGTVIQGLSNGSVFKHDFNRDMLPLFKSAQGGEKVHLWIDAAANALFGVFTVPDQEMTKDNRYGTYAGKLNHLSLAIFDEEHWQLWIDLRILLGLVKRLREKSVRRAKILFTLNKAIDIYLDDPSKVSICRDQLQIELSKPANASDPEVVAVGHAHIDTAWLWPVRESVRKCARTFSSQIGLLKEYPEYIFGASQPQHYAFVKEHYPTLYAEIKEMVKEGRWELQGGMWVEADCNLISGESMVRQILLGKNFFMDEFGIDVKNLWLPDVFGYSAALPQILQLSGINHFLTQKISWNQFNDFPHTTFMWKGIDGSDVLTHFPPENTYNSQLDTEYLLPAIENFRERGYLDEFMSLFGVGDGGGGPKAENIEYGKRLADLEGSPKVKFGTASDFFEHLEQRIEDLPSWKGELYLELHRGTLTTQAKTKKGNRKLEQKLRLTETLFSMLPLDQYPVEELDSIWKNTLMNQFHDILPGSSITKVYEVTEAEHKNSLDELQNLCDNAISKLLDKDEDSVTIFNPHSYKYEGVIEIPGRAGPFLILDQDKQEVQVQTDGDRAFVMIEIAPLSFLNLCYESTELDRNIKTQSADDLVLENSLVRHEFNSDGQLISSIDKSDNREYIIPGKPANTFTLYDDHPNDWDAWDIDHFYSNLAIENALSTSNPLVKTGPLQSSITFTLKIGNSLINQRAVLAAESAKLQFMTNVDWKEKHKMLRVAFPADIDTSEASFDIQYGFVKRPTHKNTSWDQARFEVVGQKYADLSTQDYGFAILNDCKYGHKVNESTIDLNLLRAPTYPDPDADLGEHEFVYAFYPHALDLTSSHVMREAAFLNLPPLVMDGMSTKSSNLLPFSFKGWGVTIETVKKAENSDDLIIRMVESRGEESDAEIKLTNASSSIKEVDLMEWKELEDLTDEGNILLEFKPFEIRTFKLSVKK